MGIQDKIGRAGLSRKRKLYDLNLTLTGYETLAIRLHVEENRYGDETVNLESAQKIIAKIEYPGGIPLFQDPNGNNESVGSFVYDFLPITGYFRFEDDIWPGDILVMRVFNEKNEGFIQAFRISEITGNSGLGVVSREYNLAPYNMMIDNYPEIKALIEQYESEAFSE